MKTSTLLSTVLALPALSVASKAKECKPYVDSETLQGLVNIEDLIAGTQKLQDIADANGGTRVIGSPGLDATVDYLYDTLKATGQYKVTKQPFTALYSHANNSVVVDGEKIPTEYFAFSGTGSYSGPLVLALGDGCTAEDYPAEVKGAAVLVKRGTCDFTEKATGAYAAGAEGLIIYNNESGEFGTTPFLEQGGVYPPSVFTNLKEGEALVAALAAGEVKVDMDVEFTFQEPRETYNVIAETRKGDHDNVIILGGHLDSVVEGPGINDNGSGIIALLNLAVSLTQFRIKNAVRFTFFSGEESGLLGSTHYVKSLNTSDTELAKIRAYLNFDMIASPNYILGIMDGDGSGFNLTGPVGSDVIQNDFEQYYESKGLGHVPIAFDGRSDYKPFIENGIPAGGIYTGAENNKTQEEFELFGGEVGAPCDANYHKVGDTIDNLSHEAFLLNAKNMANSLAKYALSFDSLPEVNLENRQWKDTTPAITKRSHHHDGAFENSITA